MPGFLQQLFSGGASKLIDSVGNTLDKVITTKSEKMQLENEIKKAEFDYNVEMSRLSLEEKQAVYGDLDSARTRESKVQESEHASKLGKNISSYLALIATGLCFSLFFIIIFRKDLISVESKDIIIYVLGVMSTLLAQVFAYYFGASSPNQKWQTTEVKK